MIYVTGDTHGTYDYFKLVVFAHEHPELTKKDYVIVAGDFGGVWDEKMLEEDLAHFRKLPFTVLFVDGNHENFDILDNWKRTQWKGGKVHKIREDIIHLCRGQMFTIEGKKIFTFGGATSVDVAFRREGVSWWPQETPTMLDVEAAWENLDKHDRKVDFIISHSCDEKALFYPPLCNRTTKMYPYFENLLLSGFENNVEYRHWYFGHYHMDGHLTDKKTVLYHEIYPLE